MLRFGRQDVFFVVFFKMIPNMNPTLIDHVVRSAIAQIAVRIERHPLLQHFVSQSAKIQMPKQDDLIVRERLPERLVSLARPDRTIFIVGGPGSGKTTLCHAITASAVAYDPPFVPIPVDAHSLRRNPDRFRLIRAVLGTHATESVVSQLTEEKRFLWVIDGLNEIDCATLPDGATQTIGDLLNGQDNCPVIALTRIPIPNRLWNPGPLTQETIEVTIQPFGESQRERLVLNHDVDYAHFTDWISQGGVAALIHNPQLLTLCIEIFRSEPHTAAPKSVVELFVKWFQLKWEQARPFVERPDVGRTTFLRSLATLGWHMRNRGFVAVDAATWTDLLSPFDNLLNRDGLDRQMIVDRSHSFYLMELHDAELQFIHERFEDHFAARFLLEYEDIPESLWHGVEWEEVLAHLAGLRGEDSAAGMLQQALYRKRLTLAARIVALNSQLLSAESQSTLFLYLATSLGGTQRG